MHGQNAGKDLHGVRNSGQDVHHLLQCLGEQEITPHCESLNDRNLSDLAMQYTPFVDWMTKERIALYLPTFTPEVVRRYSAFGKVRVQKIARSDDAYELVNRFFCRGFSPQTCKVAATTPTPSPNPSPTPEPEPEPNPDPNPDPNSDPDPNPNP